MIEVILFIVGYAVGSVLGVIVAEIITGYPRKILPGDIASSPSISTYDLMGDIEPETRATVFNTIKK